MAIAFNSSTFANNASDTASISFSHTNNGVNRAVTVDVTCPFTDILTGVTYGGVAMTQLGKIRNTANNGWCYKYFLLNPPSGTKTVVVSASGTTALDACASSYTGVDQVTGYDAFVVSGENFTAAFTQTLTVSTLNCWLQGSFITNTLQTQGSGYVSKRATAATQRWTVGDSNGVVATGSQSMVAGTNDASTRYWVGFMLALKPALTSANIKALVIAGGGAGCGHGSNVAGAGAGAGGFLYESSFAVLPQAYAITVGIAGVGSVSASGTAGTNSVFGWMTSIGGAPGITWGNPPVGGSGAGCSGNSGSGGGGVPGSGTPGQGFNGGQGNGTIGSTQCSSGAGGGAGGVGGSTASLSVGGTPGLGLANSISGTSVTYCAGGAGQAWNTTSMTDGVNPGDGGSGRGGQGGGRAGNGANGIVIISYATDGSDGISPSSTGGTVTTSGGQTIHTFTANGTFTMVPFLSANFFPFFFS